MTGQAERAFRRIFVVGDGVVGLSAAAAFARALPDAAVEVLALGSDPAALADRLGFSRPGIARFHAAVGLDERELIREGIATHHLATRFEGWGAAPFVHGFGDVGLPAQGISFHQSWLRANAVGRALPFDRYSAAAVIAGAGKFVHPSADRSSPLSTYLYALTLDPARYRERLGYQATATGVTVSDGAIAAIERRADGGIAGLVLSDGRGVKADLYLDCSGARGALIGQVDERFEEWGDFLPYHHVRITAVEATPPSPLTTVTTDGSGWRATHGAIAVTASASAEPIEGDIHIRPGCRPEPWFRNVLALGDSAVALDPLHGANLDLAQSAILRAIELLPSRACHPLETAEYNRRTGLEVRRGRDYVALHYLDSARAVPDDLAHTLEQWRARGRLPFHEEELFDTSAWPAALLGLGIMPRAPSVAAGRIDLNAAVAGMERLEARIAGLAAQLPPYASYLANMKRAAPA